MFGTANPIQILDQTLWYEEVTGNKRLEKRELGQSGLVYVTERRELYHGRRSINYERNPISQEWTIVEDAEPMASDLVIAVLEGRLTVENLIVGKPTFLFRGAVYPLTGNAPHFAGAETIRISIGVEDYRVLKIVTVDNLPASSGGCAANGNLSPMQKETLVFSEPVEQPPPIEHPFESIESPHGPMREFLTGSGHFSIQYPATWSKEPGEGLSTVVVAPGGETLHVSEEDLRESGYEDFTLDQYVELVLLKDLPYGNPEEISRQRILTKDGLHPVVMRLSHFTGTLRTISLVYLTEDQLAFRVTYSAGEPRYSDLQDLIAYVYRNFEVRTSEGTIVRDPLGVQ